MVETLVELGADVSQPDRDGWTPLMFATWLTVESTAERVIRLFLAHGADPLAKTTRFWRGCAIGSTAADIAKYRNRGRRQEPLDIKPAPPAPEAPSLP